MPQWTVRPRSAQSAPIRSRSAASPPKRWAHPVRSTTRAEGASSAIQGENLPAQRRSADRKAASATGSAGRVRRRGQIACASRSGWPRVSPSASASAERETSTCMFPRTRPRWRRPVAALRGHAAERRSAARRGNQSERIRRVASSVAAVMFMIRSILGGSAARVESAQIGEVHIAPSPPPPQSAPPPPAGEVGRGSGDSRQPQ
jgi:hypothetical protein